MDTSLQLLLMLHHRHLFVVLPDEITNKASPVSSAHIQVLTVDNSVHQVEQRMGRESRRNASHHFQIQFVHANEVSVV